MADPNSVSFSVGASTSIIIPAPGPTTTVWPPPPYPLGFIVVLGIEITGTATGVVIITSAGGTFPNRTLDTIQMTAGGGVARGPVEPSAGGLYQADPGSNISITNSAGTVTGSIRYCIKGAP